MIRVFRWIMSFLLWLEEKKGKVFRFLWNLLWVASVRPSLLCKYVLFRFKKESSKFSTLSERVIKSYWESLVGPYGKYLAPGHDAYGDLASLGLYVMTESYIFSRPARPTQLIGTYERK